MSRLTQGGPRTDILEKLSSSESHIFGLKQWKSEEVIFHHFSTDGLIFCQFPGHAISVLAFSGVCIFHSSKFQLSIFCHFPRCEFSSLCNFHSCIFKILFALFFRQTALQHQAVEDFHRLFQLPSRGSHCRREDFLLPWWFKPRPPIDGANSTYYATH